MLGSGFIELGEDSRAPPHKRQQPPRHLHQRLVLLVIAFLLLVSPAAVAALSLETNPQKAPQANGPAPTPPPPAILVPQFDSSKIVEFDEDDDGSNPHPGEKTVYASPADSYGFRIVLHQRLSDGKIEVHRRQGGGGGASVPSTTTTTTAFEPLPVSSPESGSSTRSSRAVTTTSTGLAAEASDLSKNNPGGPVITSGTVSSTATSTATSTQAASSGNSSVPIIAGVVCGFFALMFAAGGIYLFRKFQLKPSAKFSSRLSASYEPVTTAGAGAGGAGGASGASGAASLAETGSTIVAPVLYANMDHRSSVGSAPYVEYVENAYVYPTAAPYQAAYPAVVPVGPTTSAPLPYSAAPYSNPAYK